MPQCFGASEGSSRPESESLNLTGAFYVGKITIFNGKITIFNGKIQILVGKSPFLMGKSQFLMGKVNYFNGIVGHALTYWCVLRRVAGWVAGGWIIYY